MSFDLPLQIIGSCISDRDLQNSIRPVEPTSQLNGFGKRKVAGGIPQIGAVMNGHLLCTRSNFPITEGSHRKPFAAQIQLRDRLGW